MKLMLQTTENIQSIINNETLNESAVLFVLLQYLNK